MKNKLIILIFAVLIISCTSYKNGILDLGDFEPFTITYSEAEPMNPPQYYFAFDEIIHSKQRENW